MQPTICPGGVIGSRVRLKIESRKGWRFNSSPGHMKRSVVIIAHNEEKYIERCIQSILDQTLIPDEIVLVAHNCTDTTIEKASKFQNVTISELYGKPGIVYARIQGITHTTGDRIFCIDGDAWAEKNWIESLDILLNQSPYSFVGSFVKYTENIFWTLINSLNFLMSFFIRNKTYWVWGPSFAFSKEKKGQIIQYLKEFLDVVKKIKLEGYPDDFWVALRYSQNNPILFTRKTIVHAVAKEQNFFDGLKRSIGSNRNVPKLISYLKSTYEQ